MLKVFNQNLHPTEWRKAEKSIGLRQALHEINEIASEEARRRLCETGSAYPRCDLSVWMRNYEEDIETPISPIKCHGEIPQWLEGTLIRNGPGKQGFGDSKFQHLFDCSAVLHRFHIMKGGHCTYQSKLLKSSVYRKNLKANRIIVTEFGTAAAPDPCKTIFDRVSSVFSTPEMTDNCMISVYPFGDSMYAMTETPTIIRIDPSNLNTLDSVNVSQHVNVVHHTSHPHVVEDGTVYNLGMTVTSVGPKYSIVSFKPSSKGPAAMMESGKIECQVKARWPMHPAYMHTFGITENYYVIVEQPFSVSVPAMVLSNLVNRPTKSNLIWFDDQPTLIHVIDRNANGQKTFTCEPFFYLHIINQFEEGDNVIVDICAYKDPSMIDCMYLDGLLSAPKNPDYASMFRSRPIRLTLSMSNDEKHENNSIITPQILCNMGCETPRFNYSLLGRPYRYFYAISADVDLHNPGTLIKVDLKNGSTKTWSEETCFPSEPIFVARPDSQGEDDGVVLSALLTSSDDKKVSLLILDAASFTQLAKVDFNTPRPVPKCLHGWFKK